MAHVNETDRLQELMSKWNGMDVVGYIFVHSGLPEFTSDRHKLQTVFRRFKEQATGVKAELLSEFVFGTRDVFPFSRELERALAYLELGGLLITENPEFIKFQIREDEDLKKSLAQDAARMFTEEQRQALDELATEFREAIKE